ncbi:hypothetical protein B0H10DRAFT_2040352 [Mycena sp. CBHHK59/15]|nr:hypothetical protein B0H10DRAFT_2040352 [Mycena sp. CBHHK59/15]
MVLTRVCRDWREIAICTPEQWSTLFFDTVDKPKSSGRSKTLLFETWLSRAGVYLLSMHLGYAREGHHSSGTARSGQWRLDSDVYRPLPTVGFSNIPDSGDPPLLTTFSNAPKL